MSSLEDRVRMAIEELRDWAEENPDENEPHDAIFEIADGAVPIYSGDILQMAVDTFRLALIAPDSGPAFDGSPTPINIIATNIFEYIESKLWEAWQEIESEREDSEDSGEESGGLNPLYDTCPVYGCLTYEEWCAENPMVDQPIPISEAERQSISEYMDRLDDRQWHEDYIGDKYDTDL